MERKLQIPQHLNKLSTEQVQLGVDSIGVFEKRRVERVVEVPSRVEGRTVKQRVTQDALARVATYGSLGEYLGDKARRRRLENQDSNGWTLDDIPKDVLDDCDDWIQRQSDFKDLKGVAHQIASQQIDRMTETEGCPDCGGASSYRCYTCGDSHRMYTYPLVELRDSASGVSYEVPFDAALYIDEHPDDEVLRLNKAVDDSGSLSANYAIEFAPRIFSKSYVERATNGQIVPSEEGLVYNDNGLLMAARLTIAEWHEDREDLPSRQYPKSDDSSLGQINSSYRLLDAVQYEIAYRHLELVDTHDYNGAIDAARQKLAKRGLSLVYGWQYSGGQGGGEPVVAYYPAREDESGVLTLSSFGAYGDSPYEATADLDRMLNLLENLEERKARLQRQR